MPFLSISLFNFRNIEHCTIDLLSKEIYLIGENGQGKSNILESLYVSSYGNSFRTRKDNELVKINEQSCKIRSIYRDRNNRTNTVAIEIIEGKKKIEKNAKQIKDRKELVETIPCILFNHDDLDFAVGSPERKRFFIDQSLSMYDCSYIDLLRNYKKILKTRNALIKTNNINLLDAIDIQFVKAGQEIIERREKTIFAFNRVFTSLYEEISGITGVSIEYNPSWKVQSFDTILQKVYEKRKIDISFGMSLSGPHRDKIQFFNKKQNFIPTASTGQLRLISLILRTAQATYYTEKTGKLPILLMDDVLLELDPKKREKFTSLLPEYDQLFCTFLPEEPYNRYKKQSTKIYEVKNGCIYG